MTAHISLYHRTVPQIFIKGQSSHDNTALTISNNHCPRPVLQFFSSQLPPDTILQE